MPSCVLRYCKNTSKNIMKTTGVTFHKFPRPNRPQREKWIMFVQNDRREEFWLPSECSRICSDHFQEGDVNITKNNRRFLKSTAVPCEQLSEESMLATDSPFSTHSPLPRTSLSSDEITEKKPRTSTSTDETTKKNVSSDEEKKVIIDEVLKALKDNDEFDGIGMIVASKLRRMDEDQRIYAELLLNKILIHGIKKELQEETDLTGLKYT